MITLKPKLCAVHTWVRIDHGTRPHAYTARLAANVTEERVAPSVLYETRCIVCGIPRPKDVRVVRLTVVERTVTCPYGFNHDLPRDAHQPPTRVQGRHLRDCYLDSVTPGHRCVDPEKTGATRCPHVKALHAEYGWRTWYKRMEEEWTPYGVLHQVQPLQILYSALDVHGTQWMATNAYTGQRFEVALHATYPHRRTPEGENVEQAFRDVTIANPHESGMVRFKQSFPIWNGVPPSETMRCTCINCREFNQSRITAMSMQEFTEVHGSGVHITGAPKPDRALVNLSGVSSAPMLGIKPRVLKPLPEQVRPTATALTTSADVLTTKVKKLTKRGRAKQRKIEYERDVRAKMVQAGKKRKK